MSSDEDYGIEESASDSTSERDESFLPSDESDDSSDENDSSEEPNASGGESDDRPSRPNRTSRRRDPSRTREVIEKDSSEGDDNFIASDDGDSSDDNGLYVPTGLEDDDDGGSSACRLLRARRAKRQCTSDARSKIQRVIRKEAMSEREALASAVPEENVNYLDNKEEACDEDSCSKKKTPRKRKRKRTRTVTPGSDDGSKNLSPKRKRRRGSSGKTKPCVRRKKLKFQTIHDTSDDNSSENEWEDEPNKRNQKIKNETNCSIRCRLDFDDDQCISDGEENGAENEQKDSTETITRRRLRKRFDLMGSDDLYFPHMLSRSLSKAGEYWRNLCQR